MANINLKRATKLQGKPYAIGTHEVSDEVAKDPYLALLVSDGHAEIFDGSTKPKKLVEAKVDASADGNKTEAKAQTYNDMLAEAKETYGLFTDGKRPTKAELIEALEDARAEIA